MDIRLEWSDEDGVATFFHRGVLLRDEASVAAWRATVLPQLQKYGRKIPLLVCLDGIDIAPAVADAYGATAREVVTQYTSAFARYGEPSCVRMLIAAEALKHGVRANLFDSRAKALAHVRAQLAAGGAPPRDKPRG